MIRARRSRIVATLGPASSSFDMIVTLAKAGADVFRLNFSHGAHETHAAVYAAIREAEKVVDRPLGVLADLQGPKLRVGKFADGPVMLKAGQAFRFDSDPAPGDETRVHLPHPEILTAMRPGATLLLDDGKLRMTVTEAGPGYADTKVVNGGKLSERKGVAVPDVVIPMSPLTAKDREDLAFALRLGVDWVALSFVQAPEDMAELRRIVEGRAAVLAKIEKPQALKVLGPILDLCDGVMVARGDLGVEMAPEEVPVAQKEILRAARERGIPVIVATQMLESMTSSPTPTRAEASDVANAVYEGADAVMLSAESAAGDYPEESVSMMNRIIERVERDPKWPELMYAEQSHDDVDADVLVVAAAGAAKSGSTKCLVAFTTTGATARRLSRERPLQPVLALSPELSAVRRMCLVWGVEPRVSAQPDSLEVVTTDASSKALELGLVAPGERLLVVAGTPFGAPGAANLLRLAHAPAPARRR
ncbi:pyruvate kinase [Caulobacter vibrioides]|uniref:Pyruvate kinase n=1 Tax=Caulobacter vibrioides TaxID=155892 RepID=A0A290MW60_CAUVI|nr:pyruvate kinase [Caulobacter vibrioides]ATC31440.1 pyruvate kinase [Caulobacter vibrioides]